MSKGKGEICKNCNKYYFEEDDICCPKCGAKRNVDKFLVANNDVSIVYGPVSVFSPINIFKRVLRGKKND